MKALLTPIAAFGLVATSAAAQDFTYAGAELEYNLFRDGGAELSTTLLSAEAGISFGQIDAAIEINSMSLSSSGGLDAQAYHLEGAYRITPEISVGLAFAGFEIPFDANELELFVRYDNDTLFGEIAFGRAYEPGNFDAAIDTWSVTAGYDFGQGTEVAISHVNFEGNESATLLNVLHDEGPIGADVFAMSVEGETVFDIDVSYAINDSFDALVHGSGGFDGGPRVWAVGGRYNLNDNVGFYALIGQLTTGSDNAEYYGFGISYDLGTGAGASPMVGTGVADVYGPLFAEAKFPFFF